MNRPMAANWKRKYSTSAGACAGARPVPDAVQVLVERAAGAAAGIS